MLIHGIDVNDNVVPLLVDSSGRVIMTGDEPAPNNPVGYIEQLENLTLPAGTSTQTIFTVPASQRYLLTVLSVRYTGTVAGVQLSSIVNSGGQVLGIQLVNPVVSGVPYIQLLDILLEAGDIVSTNVIGATLNDDFRGTIALQRYK